jgi:hypothetical protein
VDADPSFVPDDIEALKAGLIAARAETAAVGAELASARAATANDRSLGRLEPLALVSGRALALRIQRIEILRLADPTQRKAADRSEAAAVLRDRGREG